MKLANVLVLLLSGALAWGQDQSCKDNTNEKFLENFSQDFNCGIEGLHPLDVGRSLSPKDTHRAGLNCSKVALIEREKIFVPLTDFQHRECGYQPDMKDRKSGSCPPLKSSFSDPYAEVNTAGREPSWIIEKSKSVGRLELRDEVKPHTQTPKPCYASVGEPQCYLYDELGTAFVVRDHYEPKEKHGTNEEYALIATSCHAIESLAHYDDHSQRWKLRQLGDGQKLLIDFGYRTEYHHPYDEFEVEELAAYPQTTKLDIVFLSVKRSHVADAHPAADADLDAQRHVFPRQIDLAKNLPQTCSNKDGPDCKATRFVLVGDPDYLHPVDPHFDINYAPIKDYGTAKIAAVGKVVQIDKCNQNAQFIDHLASTTMGESGSVLLARDPMMGEKKDHVAIGVHICCSVYFDEEKEVPPQSIRYGLCDDPARTKYNEAISSYSLRQDPYLCPYIPGGCQLSPSTEKGNKSATQPPSH